MVKGLDKVKLIIHICSSSKCLKKTLIQFLWITVKYRIAEWRNEGGMFSFYNLN